MAEKKKRLEGTSERIALPPPASVPLRLESMSNKELLQHIAQNAVLLAKKEVELAKAELKADLKTEVAMAKGLTVAGLCAIWTVSLMLVAVAMALGTAIPEWAVTVAAGVSVLALIGGVAYAVWASRQRSKPVSKARRLKHAVSRMIEDPHKVAKSEPTVPEKILAAAGTAAATVLVKKLMERAFTLSNETRRSRDR